MPETHNNPQLEALSAERRQAIGEALTEYFSALDRDIGTDTPDRILCLFDYHDSCNIDDLIDRAIVPTLAAYPVEQPAPITAQAALAAIETFEIVGENNDSREPNDEDRFILTEFIAHMFGGYPVKRSAATPIGSDREFHIAVVGLVNDMVDAWQAGIPFRSVSAGIQLRLNALVTAPVPAAADADAQSETLQRVYDLVGMGELARTPGVLMTNLENMKRRSDCLSGIELLFQYEVPDEDYPGQMSEECDLNWGQSRADYVETFKAALPAFLSRHPEYFASARTAAAHDELRNIVEAKRFDRTRFSNDTEFADWAQNRARAVLYANGGHHAG